MNSTSKKLLTYLLNSNVNTIALNGILDSNKIFDKLLHQATYYFEVRYSFFTECLHYYYKTQAGRVLGWCH